MVWDVDVIAEFGGYLDHIMNIIENYREDGITCAYEIFKFVEYMLWTVNEGSYYGVVPKIPNKFLDKFYEVYRKLGSLEWDIRVNKKKVTDKEVEDLIDDMIDLKEIIKMVFLTEAPKYKKKY